MFYRNVRHNESGNSTLNGSQWLPGGCLPNGNIIHLLRPHVLSVDLPNLLLSLLASSQSLVFRCVHLHMRVLPSFTGL